jgi:dethiobiotin synthetase
MNPYKRSLSEVPLKGHSKGPTLTFITGTDTGVGKTLLTGMLLDFLRHQGINALAMKPFCSGGTADLEFLEALQPGQLPRQRMNPFYFPEPVAPLVSARQHGRNISLPAAVRAIRSVARDCQHLLIEGSGGLMVPLGENYLVLDLIRRLKCAVIIVARNRLGTINHTLLTVQALRAARVYRLKVVLMGCKPVPVGVVAQDLSAVSNAALLAELLAPVPVLRLPFLGRNALCVTEVKKNRKKIKKTLARILDFATL